MRVRLRHQISGTRDGAEWPAPGDTIALPDDEARALITTGAAEEVAEEESASAIETDPDELEPAQLVEVPVEAQAVIEEPTEQAAPARRPAASKRRGGN
jgi:hypothetical protein